MWSDNGAKIEDNEQFLKVSQTRLATSPSAVIKREACVKLRTAHPTDWATGVTAVELSKSNERAEQRVGALRERLHIIVEGVRRT